MNRRELVRVAVGTTLAHGVVTVLSCAAQPKPAGTPPAGAQDHHGPAGAPNAAAAGALIPAPLLEVANKTGDCVVVGQTCLAHCIRLLSGGDTMLAECARRVQQMLAICQSMSALAAMGSEYSRDMAALCKKACDACAAECEKHAGHHVECKACFEACVQTSQALAALV